MAKRLTWRVVGAMTIIMTVISVFIFGIFWLLGSGMLTGLYLTEANVLNERINNAFTTVEVALANNVPEVEENIHNDQRQYYAVEHLLRLNPNIVGAAVAYNPDYEPKKGQPFAPYAFRDSTGIHTKQLNSKSYDYLHQHWYTAPLEQKQGTWSEPYIDEGGGNIPMITFSLPLTNSKGEIYAVQTADIALDWMNDLRQEMEKTLDDDTSNFFGNSIGESAYSFIVTRQGAFITHPDKQLVLNRSLYEYFHETILTQNNDSSIVNDILKNDGNTIRFFIDKKNKVNVSFSSEIKRTDWKLIVVVPLNNIIKPINYIIVTFLAIMFFGILLVALICRHSIRRVTKPLRRFADSADEIAKGNFQAELPRIKTKDEMLRLRNSFETMQASLVRQIEETRTVNEEKGRMESELHIARNIQMAMLPKTFPPFPDRSDIDIYAQLMPAKEVGGDLYDFYIRDEKLFFCIGDVSGKGVPASLVMAVTRSLFRSLSAHENRPSRILRAINDSMSKDNESDMFVTFFMGVLDLPTGRLRYCNAGHNAPVAIASTSRHSPHPTQFLNVIPNLPFGIITDWKYEEQEVVMVHGDTLFLYTDGLNEAENFRHQPFGDQAILTVAQTIGALSAKEQTEAMTEAVNRHVNDAEQSDDLTILCLKYLPIQDENVHSSHLTLLNNVDELNKLPEFVDTVCEEAHIDMMMVTSLNLALDEAVTNVVLYAYGDREGTVDIEAIYTDKYIKFIITDSGIPFDPTQTQEVDITLGVEERPIGGLGIHLVRQIMDTVNYERTDGKNILTLTKKLTPAQE